MSSTNAAARSRNNAFGIVASTEGEASLNGIAAAAAPLAAAFSDANAIAGGGSLAPIDGDAESGTGGGTTGSYVEYVAGTGGGGMSGMAATGFSRRYADMNANADAPRPSTPPIAHAA